MTYFGLRDKILLDSVEKKQQIIVTFTLYSNHTNSDFTERTTMNSLRKSTCSQQQSNLRSLAIIPPPSISSLSITNLPRKPIWAPNETKWSHYGMAVSGSKFSADLNPTGCTVRNSHVATETINPRCSNSLLSPEAIPTMYRTVKTFLCQNFPIVLRKIWMNK